MSPFGPIRSFLGRSRSERRLLVESLVIVTGVRVALTVVPYRVLRRMRRGVVRLASRFAGPAHDAHALGAAVRVAARHVPAAHCLTQAIALHLMLARRSMRSTLVIGVARRDGAFAAHAWVDRDGDVLIGGDIAPYDTLIRVGSRIA